MTDECKPQQAVGGQAIIEGVFMRTPYGVAIAVRHPDGSIILKDKPWRSWTKRYKPLSWPFIRGIAVLIESLKEGIDGLRFSAEMAVAAEEGREYQEEPQSKSGKLTANLALILGFGLAMLLFKGVPHGISLWLGLEPTQTLFHVVDGVVKLTLVVAYITAISRMKDIQRVFEYHGAEHKSIRAFEQRAELTVEQTKPFTRLHERCGTSFIIVVVLASVLVYIAASFLIPTGFHGGWLFQVGLIFAKILLLGPVAAIAYEINRWAGAHWKSPLAKIIAWPGLLMQRLLTTREPSADQLEVGLASLRAALVYQPEDSEGEGATRDWQTRRFASFEELVQEISAETELTPEHSEAA